MNHLVSIKTMSSREIADITGKQHKNVLSDCDKLNENYKVMGMAEISAVNYRAENGYKYLGATSSCIYFYKTINN